MNTEKVIKEYIDSKNWEKLAEAFHKQDIQWHAKEWESFISSLIEKERAEAYREGYEKGLEIGEKIYN